VNNDIWREDQPPYVYFFDHLVKVIRNEMDPTLFEDTMRLAFGVKSFVMFSLGHLVTSISKHLRKLLNDEFSLTVAGLFLYERQRSQSSSAIYHSNLAAIIGSRRLFLISFNEVGSVLSMSLISPVRFVPTVDTIGTEHPNDDVIELEGKMESESNGRATLISVPLGEDKIRDEEEPSDSQSHESEEDSFQFVSSFEVHSRWETFMSSFVGSAVSKSSDNNHPSKRKRHATFLQRNVRFSSEKLRPTSTSQIMENTFSSNGLLLQIDPLTLKPLYCTDTEDSFYRIRPFKRQKK